jgi:hypothetical protein
MRQKDFRSIGRDTQEALRGRAVFLVLTVRKSQAEAAEAVGVSRQTVNQWLKRHAKAGEDGLLDGRRVSARKGKGKLTATEAVRVKRADIFLDPVEIGNLIVNFGDQTHFNISCTKISRACIAVARFRKLGGAVGGSAPANSGQYGIVHTSREPVMSAEYGWA